MPLKLGRIDYLNCVPFFHHLPQCGFDGNTIAGVPAELNEMLAQGSIDVSPSSSFEYGCRFRDYVLLPHHSISALHSVKSVLLFSPVPIEELEGHCIYLTGESATSVNLLRVMLREYYGWSNVKCLVPEQPIEDLLQEKKPVLMIGDRALKAATHYAGQWYQYDLAQLWYQFTQLPFVFALWIVRRESLATLTDELLQLQQQLEASRKMAFADLNSLAKSVQGKEWITTEQLVEYWQSMSYSLDDQHVKGLTLFFQLCVKYEYLAEMPEISFVDMNC
ncbi:MAG: hypothetical protein BA874_04455 [Desulfuromonadales bacterium C00003068]|jgi:chorismate dehydratase|nr:MAG: hypothetical protein BA874_04455 [Desulfuromonadales bacterium C00003068]